MYNTLILYIKKKAGDGDYGLKTIGLEPLIKSLEFNTSLTRLDISHNKIDEIGLCVCAHVGKSKETRWDLNLK